MKTCREIIEHIQKFCPEYMAKEWDNVGLLVGDREQEITKILVALEVTDAVIDEAVNVGANMIVTHHPLFIPKRQGAFNSITTDFTKGKYIHKLARNNISLYSAHTNLDIADGGINDLLVDMFNLKSVKVLQLEEGKNYGLGRIGELENELNFEDFLKLVKKNLNLNFVRYVGKENKKISKVALCSGGGMDLLKDAIKSGADVYLAGDVKYHDAQEAFARGLFLVDAGHYETENIIVPVMKKHIDKLGGVEVVESKVDANPLKIC